MHEYITIINSKQSYMLCEKSRYVSKVIDLNYLLIPPNFTKQLDLLRPKEISQLRDPCDLPLSLVPGTNPAADGKT